MLYQLQFTECARCLFWSLLLTAFGLFCLPRCSSSCTCSITWPLLFLAGS